MTLERLPSRWHPLRFLLVALICFAVTLLLLCRSSREVTAATGALPTTRCAETTWAGLVGWCRGLVLLQLAGDPASAETVVQAVRQPKDVTPAAVRSVRLDYLFILSYVACLGFLGATVASFKAVGRVGRVIVLLFAALQGVAGVLDGIENVGLLEMLNAPSVMPGVAERTFWVAVTKWWLTAAGALVPLGFFLWALFRSARRRA
jgi:hypothetical protein